MIVAGYRPLAGAGVMLGGLKEHFAKQTPQAFLNQLRSGLSGSVLAIDDKQYTRVLQAFQKGCVFPGIGTKTDRRICKAMQRPSTRLDLWDDLRRKARPPIRGGFSLKVLKDQLEDLNNAILKYTGLSVVIDILLRAARKVCQIPERVLILGAVAAGIEPTTARAMIPNFCRAVKKKSIAQVARQLPNMIKIAAKAYATGLITGALGDLSAELSTALPDLEAARAVVETQIGPHATVLLEAELEAEIGKKVPDLPSLPSLGPPRAPPPAPRSPPPGAPPPAPPPARPPAGPPPPARVEAFRREAEEALRKLPKGIDPRTLALLKQRAGLKGATASNAGIGVGIGVSLLALGAGIFLANH